MKPLYQLVADYRALEALDPDDVPEEVLRDTLEGLSGEVTIKATNVALFARNLDAYADAVEDAGRKMSDRADRIRRRAISVKAYLLNCMQGAGITKIEATELTLAIRKNPPSVIVDNEAWVPAEFKVQPPPPPPHVDKRAVAAALKAGSPVAGCHLEQSERLDIRT